MGLIYRVPDGLPEYRSQFDMSKYFNVIKKESSIKDESINDRIQREGCSTWFEGCKEQELTGGEAEWYVQNKGYSSRLK